MRIITLTLNTLKLARGIKLKGCHFFDLIDCENAVLQANEREYIVRVGHGEPRIIPKDEIPPGTYTGYGEKNDFTEGKILIQYKEDFSSISDFFERIPYSKSLSPIYLKDPHITWSKKSTSHS